MTLPIVTLALIEKSFHRSLHSASPKNWEGTVLDFLNEVDCLSVMKINAILHSRFLSESVVRAFAVDCLRHAMDLFALENVRLSAAASNVAERVMLGTATQDEAKKAALNIWNETNDAAMKDASFHLREAFYYCAMAYCEPLWAACVHAASAAECQSMYSPTRSHTHERARQVAVLKKLISAHMV